MKEDKPDIISFNVKAIWSIRNDPNASIGETYEDLIWHDNNDETKPTKKEFDDAVAICKSEWNAQDYARARKDEYPSYAEQFDILYHKGIAGLKAELKKTKDKYPKLKTQQ